MSIESEISLLTQATTDLLSAVNVRKVALDNAADEAETQAGLALGAASTASEAASTATTKAGEAATSADTAQAAAQAAENFADGLVASPTVGRVEVLTTAQYDALTPVAGTLYVIED